MLQIEENSEGREKTAEEVNHQQLSQQAVIPKKNTLPSNEVLSIVREVLEEQVGNARGLVMNSLEW